MKEQEKSPEKQLEEMEESNIPDTEFKTIVIRMLKKFRGRMAELSENLNKNKINIEKDIGTIKKNQSEMNTLRNQYQTDAEPHLSDLEGKVSENIRHSSTFIHVYENENSSGDHWENVKHNNICIKRVPEGEGREQGIENLLKKK